MFDFLRKDRIYVLMAVFILVINIANTGRVENVPYDEKEGLSTKTFEEMGVTEEAVKDYFKSEAPRARFFKYALVLGFYIFLASLILNIWFFFRQALLFISKGARRPPIMPAQSSDRPVSWGIPDLIRASIVIVFIGYIIGIIDGFLFRLFNLNMESNLHMMLGTFFIDIAAGAVVLYFVMVKYRQGLQDIGLKGMAFFRNVLSGIKGYIFMLPLLVVTLVLSVWILNLLGYTPPPQPVFEIFMEEKRSRVLLFLTIFVSVFGPVAEEVFFRGFMYSAIKKHLGTLCAAFLSGAIFSILHANIVGFLPIMTLGILLAYLYERTGSLVASIAVHIAHNSVILCFVFFVKELMA